MCGETVTGGKKQRSNKTTPRHPCGVIFTQTVRVGGSRKVLPSLVKKMQNVGFVLTRQNTMFALRRFTSQTVKVRRILCRMTQLTKRALIYNTVHAKVARDL
jgi:hypothetical protein